MLWARQMKQTFLFIGLLSSMHVYGQSNGGSAYSIFGIGELKPNVSAQNVGMGFTSIGMSNPYYVNTVNPAANAVVGGYFSHIFDVGIFMNNTQLESAKSRESVGNGGLSQLSYWFRFNNRWTGLLGLSNFSNVGYNIVDNSVLVSNNNEYLVNYEGSGGLSNIYFSNSFLITKNLSVGAKLSFIFGNIFNNEIATSVQGNSAFNVENSVHVKRMNVDFGLNYLVKLNKNALNLGFIYDNGARLPGTVNSSITSSDAVVIYDESESTSNYVLPKKLGFGVSFRSEQLVLAGDLEYKPWSQASIGNEDDLNDTWRTSFGLEITPDMQGESLLQRMSYRVGGYRENFYLDVDNTSFVNWGITTGVGIPLFNGSVINLAYHRKYSGTRRNDLILESTNEISLNVSIRERWFVKSKYN